jgi:hypothetical protein
LSIFQTLTYDAINSYINCFRTSFSTRRAVTKLGYLLAAVASLRSYNMRWKLVLYPS